MTTRLAINGYGRIGRNILRAIYENKRNDELSLVAVNNTMTLETGLHLTRFDTTHGRFNADISLMDGALCVNGDRIEFLRHRDPLELPWDQLDIDIVLDCSGKFTKRDTAAQHLQAGAKKVLVSAPCTNADQTVVWGVNHHQLEAGHLVISAASCTTNCIAPVAQVLHRSIGIDCGLITTVHSYTNDQVLIDANHPDLRRARSATTSMIPTKTGAARAVGLVLPELQGKLHGHAIRVPTLNVSMVDLTFRSLRPTNTDEVNTCIRNGAQGSLEGILEYSEEPLVSCDFNHNPASAIFDATLTKVMEGSLVKVCSWYDNEWGYSNRMLDLASHIAKVSS